MRVFLDFRTEESIEKNTSNKNKECEAKRKSKQFRKSGAKTISEFII